MMSTDDAPAAKRPKKSAMRVDDEDEEEAGCEGSAPKPTQSEGDPTPPEEKKEEPTKHEEETGEEEEEDDDEEDYESDKEKAAKPAAAADEGGDDDGDDDAKTKTKTAAKRGLTLPTGKKTSPKPKPLKQGPITYDPVADAGFKKGEPLPYLSLARAFVKIEGTSQRLAKTEHLANLLRSIVLLSPGDLILALYLIAGKVGPDYLGVELGVGESLLIKAIADAYGKTAANVRTALRTAGDLGKVAVASKQRTRTLVAPQPLTVRFVFDSLREIAKAAGQQSRNKKQDRILRLLVACRESEAQYIVRMLQGKFRIGCSEKTVLAALARALVQTPPGQETVVDAAKELGADAFAAAVASAHAAIVGSLAEVPSYDEVIPAILEPGGLSTVRQRCRIRPGMPVHPMLAQPTKGVGEVLNRLEAVGFTCEYKYDGERAQIHIVKPPPPQNGQQSASSSSSAGTAPPQTRPIVKVYSRNLEDSTSKFPDVAEAVSAAAKESVDTCIIDSEAVGWDPEQRKLLPFQTLSHRARKDVAKESVKVRVCVFAFDLLYLNGVSLLDEPLRRRRELLREHFRETEGSFVFATFKNIAAGEGESAAVQPFLEEAVKNQCEGLMVKAFDQQSAYIPNQRSFNWLKIKKDYMEGMTDSVDLVPIGAWYGTGKRTGCFGGYLMACYDEDTESFQAMTKVATGLNDADLEQLYNHLSKFIIPAPKPYYSVSPSMKSPDVWFDAVQVWEIKGADLTISPAYMAAAGAVDPSRGVSLRFPRFLRVRDDKKPELATNSEQVAAMYNKQTLCIAAHTARHKDADY